MYQNDNRNNQKKQVESFIKTRKHLEKPTELKKVHKIFIKNMSDKNLKMETLEECGNLLMFQTNETKRKFLLSGGNFCKNRFCPICSWLKAKKTAFKLMELIKVIQLEEQKEFVFVTLTVPNCSGEDLDYTIRELNKATQRLMQRKEIKSMNFGNIRKLEVTYNPKRNDFHPHIHMLWCVDKSYFKSRKYLKKRRLLELWQSCAKNKNITQVDIKACEFKTVKDIMEIATYSVKIGDLFSYGKDIFDYFYIGLKGKRLIVYSGLFKEYKKKIEKKEIDVDEIPELRELREKTLYEIVYTWERQEKQYTERQLRELEETSRRWMYDIQLKISDSVDKRTKI